MASHKNLTLTPHERLYLAGQLNEFELCVLAENKKGMIDILCNIDLDQEQALNFVDKVLSNPRKYGYCDGGCLIH